MKYALVVGGWLLFWMGDATAQLRAAGYAHGTDHCYNFQAPLGWDMDANAMASEGVPAVFHPPGTAWRQTWTMVYTRPVPKAKDDKDPIRTQIEGVLAQYEQDADLLTAKRIGTLEADLGAVGEVWEFTGYRHGGSEVGVYFNGPETVNFFVAPILRTADPAVARTALFDVAASYVQRNDCVPCEASGACRNAPPGR